MNQRGSMRGFSFCFQLFITKKTGIPNKYCANWFCNSKTFDLNPIPHVAGMLKFGFNFSKNLIAALHVFWFQSPVPYVFVPHSLFLCILSPGLPINY